jgi:hypothetical protein
MPEIDVLDLLKRLGSGYKEATDVAGDYWANKASQLGQGYKDLTDKADAGIASMFKPTPPLTPKGPLPLYDAMGAPTGLDDPSTLPQPTPGGLDARATPFRSPAPLSEESQRLANTPAGDIAAQYPNETDKQAIPPGLGVVRDDAVPPPAGPIVAPKEVQDNLPPPEAELPEVAAPKDPNDIILQAYKQPIMEAAMAARKRDLERMDSPAARTDAHLMMMQGLIGRDSALTTAGSSLLRKSAYDPIHAESLEQAGKTAEQLGKGQIASDAVDPNSQTSRAARMITIESPAFASYAQAYAKKNKVSEVEARHVLASQMQGLSQVGVEAFQKSLKASGDYTEQRAKEARDWALKEQTEAQTKGIAIESATKETLFEALKKPDSNVTNSLRATVAQIYPAAAGTPGFDRMTGLELEAAYPKAAERSAEIMKFRQEYNMRLTSDIAINDEWQVATSAPRGMAGGYEGLRVPNQIGVTNKGEFLKQNQSAKVALDAADDLLRMSIDPGTAFSVKLNTPQGQRVKQMLQRFAENASALSPAGRIMLDELQKMGNSGSLDVTEFIFGSKGKKANVKSALREMNSNHQNIATTYVNTKVAQGEIPATPPTWLPMEMDTAEIVGKVGAPVKVPAYVFDVNGHKVGYWRDANNTWVKKVD